MNADLEIGNSDSPAAPEGQNLNVRFERIRELARACGVKFVTEAELRARNLERRRRELRSGRRDRPPPAAIAEARLPYKDVDDRESITPPLAASPGEREAEFLASGKGDSADARCVAFWSEQIRLGRLWVVDGVRAGEWFSRKFLKEICGNDYVNNRIDKARPHFLAHGFKIEQAEVAPAGQPATSHYRLVAFNDDKRTL